MYEIKFGEMFPSFYRFYRLFNIWCAVTITVLAVISVAIPDHYKLLPAIFLIGSASEFLSAYESFVGIRRRKKKKVGKGIALTVIGLILLGLAVISFFCFWR